MINCDGWLIDPARLLTVGRIVEEHGVYWFSLKTICGEEYLVCRRREMEVLDLQTRLLRAISERGMRAAEREASEQFWGWRR